MLRSSLLGLLVLSLVGLNACGDDDAPSDAAADADLDSGPPAPPDGSRIPDGATLCSADSDCDDAVGCTRDLCDEIDHYCRHPVDPAVCDDAVFCNGVEQCDPLLGCVAGHPESCNDDDVCTIDRCDEEEKICRHGARDFDEDGEADWHCEGGTDCDDRDPLRRSTANEICGDMIDNDCDEEVDESDCGRTAHDTCDDPLDVTGGGTFVVSHSGTLRDYNSTCNGSRNDIVLSFTLAETRSVIITADGPGFPGVAIRSSCELRTSEIECVTGFPARARVRELGPGTYYAILSDYADGEWNIEVEFGSVVPPPTNETCASPIDLGAGGTIAGSLVDVADDYALSCSSGAGRDLVYSFTTAEVQDVAINLVSLSGNFMNFEVRTGCVDELTAVRCASGAPAGATLHELPAGTYFIIVEGSSSREVDFTLDVQFSAPTPPAVGDTCATAIPLVLGTPTLGTLADKEDDIPISCSFYNRDAVYSFELTERSDVNVTVDGSGTFTYASVRSDCGDADAQLRCDSGNPARARLRDLPVGVYYVIVESSSGTGFNLAVDASPPRVEIPVSGNDNCATAVVVPPTGALYSGDTTANSNDYETALCGSMARAHDAAFELTLASRSRVLATTDGSTFDTVLHVHSPMCVTRMDMLCDDDGGDGSASLIERTLDPGTYYFIVDGYGTSSAGAYQFEISVAPP